MLTLASLAVMPVLASTQPLQLSRLDADPVVTEVLAGRLDAEFVAMPGAVIRERDAAPRWWRIVSARDFGAAGSPQLVLRSPGLNRVEVWLPGKAMPIRRSLLAEDSGRSFSTRGLVVPLRGGLAAGEPLYLRVDARGTSSMPVSVQPLAAVHRADLRHVALRTMSLTALLVLAVLALVYWLGIRERVYGYLCLALLAQLCFSVVSGGEIRLLPALAQSIGGDLRATRILGLLAATAWFVFLGHYLDLRARQPRLMSLLAGCMAVLCALMVASLVSGANLIAMLANLAVLLGVGLVLSACVVGAFKRQRAAYFLLLSWLPLMFMLTLSTGAWLGVWSNPPWVAHGVTAALAVSGLIVTIGLSDTAVQLRRDRDQASRRANFDTLTGALTRLAFEQRLQAAVAESHERGRPLSVVFFDVDRFKRINDEHGHRVGDSCLRIIALRTGNRLRTYDLIGRWGGDELLVMLPDTRLGEALGVAENLRSAVNCRPLSIEGRLLDASLSLGVAELAAGETAEQLIERADAGLYASKSTGRDRVTGHDPRVSGSQPAFAGTPDARAAGAPGKNG